MTFTGNLSPSNRAELTVPDVIRIAIFGRSLFKRSIRLIMESDCNARSMYPDQRAVWTWAGRMPHAFSKTLPVFFASIKPTFEIIVYQRSRYLSQGAIHGKRSFDTPRCRHIHYGPQLVRLHRFASEFQIQCHREIDKGAFQRLAVTFGFSLVGIAGYLNRITDPYDPRERIRKNKPSHEEKTRHRDATNVTGSRAAPDSLAADIAPGATLMRGPPRAIGRDANIFATLQCANYCDQRIAAAAGGRTGDRTDLKCRNVREMKMPSRW